jgi:hypothetical protein
MPYHPRSYGVNDRAFAIRGDAARRQETAAALEKPIVKIQKRVF